MMSWKLVMAVGRRPDLWSEGVRSLFAFSPRNWWRTTPFLPTPDRAYAEWRLVTAHGDATTPLTSYELISFLEWRRGQHRMLGRV